MKKIIVMSNFFANFLCFSQEISKMVFTDSFKENKYTQTFEYKRIIIEKNIFEEKGIFSRDTISGNTTQFFKIENNKWYFKKKNKWFVFFDRGKNTKSIFLVNGSKYLLRWKKTNVLDEDIYELKLYPIGFRISHIPSYLFTPKDGIIAICGQDIFFVREDKKYLLSFLIK